MKKFFKLISIMFVFLAGSASAFADCHTGFACSINDLEAKQYFDAEYINKINNYFNKQVNENLFFGRLNSDVNYNDLFIFNTIV